MSEKTNLENTAAPLIPTVVDIASQPVVEQPSPSVVSTADAVPSSPDKPDPNVPDVPGKEQAPVLAEIQLAEAALPSTDNVNPSMTRPGLRMALEAGKFILFPASIFCALAAGVFLLGLAQRLEWITPVAQGDSSSKGSSEISDVSWICPMMCVPQTNQPGRCPVCAMELVPAAAGSSSGPSTTIEIDPRSRRVAGIQTTSARLERLSREINGVGEIVYDETNQKTLAAYIDGRIEELTADYTGVTVKKGESLGLLYSPDLYSAQVEFLKTLEFKESNSSSNPRVINANERLLKSSRQKLSELGLTEDQIRNLESKRIASRVLDLYAPISGTVIKKAATTGQYIKAGEPIYQLADLSKVWLVLELFPEDALSVQIGQPVKATSQSLDGQTFDGIVEFIEPVVDSNTRTVGVRIAVDNRGRKLKPGEFAEASFTVPVSTNGDPASKTIVIPRDALLSIGKTSLAYVEIEPGEFELRKIKTGPTVDGMVAVFEGIDEGENVVSKSTFLLDAQMQLQGNPSLIDPDKSVAFDSKNTELTDAEREEIRSAMAPMSVADRKLAEAQVICPVTEVRLGSMGMGTPIKLEVNGRTVFICCEGCRDGMVNESEKFFKILDDYLSGKSKNQSKNDSDFVIPKTKSELPQMQLPQMELPQMELPKMELPKMDSDEKAEKELGIEELGNEEKEE